jgi:hypothetical protein
MRAMVLEDIGSRDARTGHRTKPRSAAGIFGQA